jgi:hypothetical protein
VSHYIRGKVDWILRGLPTEPRVPLRDRLDALPYFVNNLAPWMRSAWIRLSCRVTAGQFASDDLRRVAPDAPVPALPAHGLLAAIVLDHDGVMLGAIEQDDSGRAGRRAFEVMNPAPQTIRPDMTISLASALMGGDGYLIVSDAFGRYIGRYHRPLAQAK